MSHRSRREFLQDSAALTAGLTALNALPGAAVADDEKSDPGKATAGPKSFASDWKNDLDRVWLGAEYWANPLQDWRVADGKIECVNPALDRNVHLLTFDLSDRPTGFTSSVTVGRSGDAALFSGKGGAGKGSFGFRLGASGPLKEYRNNLMSSNGIDAGVAADGRMFVGDQQSDPIAATKLQGLKSVELRLEVKPGPQQAAVCLQLVNPEGGETIAELCNDGVPAARLVGNVALVANFGKPGGRRGPNNASEAMGTGRFWFADWKLDGDKLDAHPKRRFGPVWFTQYTLSGGVLTLTAQMPPIGEQDNPQAELQTQQNGEWKTIATADIHPDARTATFRVGKWDDTQDHRYRVTYELKRVKGKATKHHWAGTVRRDPTDKPEIVVADISCNIHSCFPNHEYVDHVAKLEPDLMAFVGDQFYESTGGYGVVRTPDGASEAAFNDYLRKWAMHGWTWRELTRDRPSISLPDDHDVYQGNLWGESGAPEETTQEAGGYNMAARWVNVVHRTQTSHHPAAYDDTPCKQGISVYFGPMTYGRISFALLADRQFKTGPEGVAPPTMARADHVIDPNFDPKTADVPGADLLGERQLRFLNDWVEDWKAADMKAVISQTIFTAMATTHGAERMRLYADYDTNGWPQSPRNEALKIIRKASAVHIAGDQHLPAVVQYGIEKHGDAGVAFAGPAVNVGYPRWWEPEQPGGNRKPGASEITGDFTDHFGHPLTVLAVKNGAEKVTANNPLDVAKQRASGLGIVRLNKQDQTITFECWPYLADPTKEEQFEGWPVQVKVSDNDGREAVSFLPPLGLPGVESGVAHLIDEVTGELVYARRFTGRAFRAPVFAAGTYTVRLSDPDRGLVQEWRGLTAAPGDAGPLSPPQQA